ncbi:hypothetical protein DEO72_LG6g2377 [Vigna unguiculata]|uniref:Uncharacterized protein n=1 Tax=Vigna unguiculata TaxID=3917 RepID=A0A4D6MC72_VIGUN|nr:hypothetical protein DEO72_LG6g2377 [Vigna unguiculata]
MVKPNLSQPTSWHVPTYDATTIDRLDESSQVNDQDRSVRVDGLRSATWADSRDRSGQQPRRVDGRDRSARGEGRDGPA